MDKIKKREQHPIRNWTIEDARKLYQLREWGCGYFDINKSGHVVVTPFPDKESSLDLLDFTEELQERGIQLPVLLRFSDVLRQRMIQLNEAFSAAITEYEFEGCYRGVYPIKVNQHRNVVEEIVKFGREYGFGLEAGSKPELLIAMPFLDTEDALLVCNGYKDEEFIETALLGTKIGKNILLVVEKLSELEIIVKKAVQFKVDPVIGVRAKLSARGFGPWEGSGGDKSKFGLFASEIIRAVEILRANDKLHCLQMLHFHLGSQISSISHIKQALVESTQIFAALHKMGVNIRYFDVGGGLAVDYDGSKSNFASSANYTLSEYASDVVWALKEACDKNHIPHPVIISESGRALVAHHAVLVVEVLGSSSLGTPGMEVDTDGPHPEVLAKMVEVREDFTPKGFREAYHDAIQIREEAMSLFRLGYLTLEERARVETVFWEICHLILKIVRDLDHFPDDMAGLERFMADIYFCNFSVFQSVPDHWAMKQLFPVMPIHRLRARPSRRATLADVTCDSDGKMDQFIDPRDIKDTLELHEVGEAPYYLGVFLVGAYQEILGDMHNLFGDTNIVHVRIMSDGRYEIDKVIRGDTVTEVMGYVQYTTDEMLHMMHLAIERGVKEKKLTLRESARFVKMFEEGLRGYTYLESE
ncbi:biosynthetic arginine decarboxylase [bacterium]|nr:biosynthetic arginine decarboxylase [candidate division CSSED10-310 bacterium]